MITQNISMREKKQNIEQFLLSTGFRIGLLSLTVVLLTCHVLKMSSISTQGYEISALQNRIQTIEEEKQRIDIDIARQSSMEHIQNKVQEMHFVPIEKPQYITVHGMTVASR